MKKIKFNFNLENLIILPALVIVFYVVLYPPFIPGLLDQNAKTIRVFLEGSLLISLAFYLLRIGLRLHLFLATALFIYLLNFFINADSIEKILSHFNKLALLILLPVLFKEVRVLAHFFKKAWVVFWTYNSIAGILGFCLFMSKISMPQILDNQISYHYYYYDFLGSYLLKTINGVVFPRYTNFFIEPIILGLFFGLNLIIKDKLIKNVKKRNVFFILNLIAGFLTLSYAYAFFVLIFAFLKSSILKNIFTRKYITVISLFLIFISIAQLPSVPNSENILPYSSLLERLQQIERSLSFLSFSPISKIFFGSGVMFFQNKINGGASAGFFDFLGAWGVVLLIFWSAVIYQNVKKMPGLFSYLLLYTLVLNYWHFPFFILAISIIKSLETTDNSQELYDNRY